MANDNPELPRRKLLKISGGIGTAVAAAGCTGGGSDGKGSSEALVTESRIGTGSSSFSYWAIKSHSPQDGNKKFAKTIKNDFYKPWAKNHKKYQIDYELQPSYSQFQTKLTQATANGNAPAASIADSVWFPNFADSLTPITGRVKDKDDWFSFVKDIVVRDGEWLTVWQNTDVRALYYRKDMIQKHGSGKAPETWEELISVGKKISQKEDMNGFMFNGGRWEGTTFDNLAYYWGQGGQILTDDRKIALDKNGNRQKLQNVFEFLKRTVDSGVAPKRVASIKDYNMLTQAAVNEETAMFLGGNWQIASIKEEVDDWQNWKVARIPQLKADMSATGSGGWTQCVFADDKKVSKAAKDFTTMWLDKDKMATYAKKGGYLPTRPSIFENHEFFANDPYQQTFGKLLKDSHARPGGPAYTTFSTQFQVAAGKVLTGQASPKQVTDTLISQVLSEHGN